MRREGIRILLAWAIGDTLNGHALTYINAKRYCTRDRLSCFGIRKETRIHESDWQHALHMAIEESRMRYDDGLEHGRRPDRARMILIAQRLNS